MKKNKKINHIFFLRRMSDDNLIRFLEENSNFSFKNISEIISNIKEDSLKIKVMEEYEFEIEERIRIIKTFK